MVYVCVCVFFFVRAVPDGVCVLFFFARSVGGLFTAISKGGHYSFLAPSELETPIRQ